MQQTLCYHLFVIMVFVSIEMLNLWAVPICLMIGEVIMLMTTIRALLKVCDVVWSNSQKKPNSLPSLCSQKKSNSQFNSEIDVDPIYLVTCLACIIISLHAVPQEEDESIRL